MNEFLTRLSQNLASANARHENGQGPGGDKVTIRRNDLADVLGLVVTLNLENERLRRPIPPAPIVIKERNPLQLWHSAGSGAIAAAVAGGAMFWAGILSAHHS